MVWIRTVGLCHGISTMTDDQLLDTLQVMGTAKSCNYSPGAIRATYEVAARRGLITFEEANAGVKEVLTLRRRAVAASRAIEATVA